MPEIDTELFQQIALGLLALLLLVGLLVLNSLGKIRKTLEKGVVARPDEGPSEEGRSDEPVAAETSAAASEPAAATEQAASDTYSPWSQPSQEPAPQTAAEPAPAAQPAATEAVPEEQPFERDGRWWFKRGDELLVYDEQTGQWTAAPADSPLSASGSAGGESSPATQEMPATTTTSEGGFWKCPSCGAVNGSTSATCRMCFTPRPA